MAYFAELDSAGVVQRVIVAESAEWCVEHLGGTWEETADPYAEPGDVAYAGPGHGFDDTFPQRFAPPWVQPQPGVEGREHYDLDAVVFHAGRLWRSTTPVNVWEPGVSGWHPSPVGGQPPAWVQPTGAHDAWPLGCWVTHGGQVWESLIAANVWEPGAPGTAALWRLVVDP